MDKIWIAVTLPPAAGVTQEKQTATEQVKPSESGLVQAAMIVPLAVSLESPQCCPPGCCG